MRKIILAVFVAFLAVISCSESKDNPLRPQADPIVILPAEEGDVVADAGTAAASGDEDAAEEGLALIDGSDCRACHHNTNPLVGPTYTDVANKYTADDTDMLIDKIIEGGAGNWGQVPMSPHPNVSRDDGAKMVAYILSLK